GTDAAGTANPADGTAANGSGVVISAGAQNNRVGTDGNGKGVDTNERNVLAGNFLAGVLIRGAGSSGKRGAGEFIGTDATGAAALGNDAAAPGNDVGIRIDFGAHDNRIGTNGDGVADAAERNVISGNGNGIELFATGTINNVVAGNFIGTTASG